MFIGRFALTIGHRDDPGTRLKRRRTDSIVVRWLVTYDECRSRIELISIVTVIVWRCGRGRLSARNRFGIVRRKVSLFAIFQLSFEPVGTLLCGWIDQNNVAGRDGQFVRTRGRVIVQGAIANEGGFSVADRRHFRRFSLLRDGRRRGERISLNDGRDRVRR